jgi:hypothetical protein
MRLGSVVRRGAVGLFIAVWSLVPVSAAGAADLWTQTGQSFTSVDYWQGIAFDAGSRSFYFDGPEEGIWRTDASLHQTGGRSTGIPTAVTSAQGWNHLGDLTFDANRKMLLVPLECYYPVLSDPNTCKTGGVGVIDPSTLAWRYFVKFGGIPKAMWVEESPDGKWLWTSLGTDLLAYDASQLTAANATIAPSKRLVAILPASGVSGATFVGGRLYLAFDRGSYEQVQSAAVDPTTGDIVKPWRTEIQRTKSFGLYETEGLAGAPVLGGALHWQIQPEIPLYTRILHLTQ